jgi:hypothetical protein
VQLLYLRPTRFASFHIPIPLPLPTSIMAVTREQFEEIFPVLVQDLTNHCCDYNLPEKALVWYRNV